MNQSLRGATGDPDAALRAPSGFNCKDSLR
jgi:hypothetical protein